MLSFCQDVRLAFLGWQSGKVKGLIFGLSMDGEGWAGCSGLGLLFSVHDTRACIGCGEE